MRIVRIGRVAITIIAIFTVMTVYSQNVKKDDIVGQWRNVVKNPSHKNTVSKRYMRHTFFADGTLVVENKEKSQKQKHWELKDGIIIVNSSYKTSKFIEHYKLINHNELMKIRFKSIIKGEPLADYNPKERYIRQDSETEKKMKKWDIFQSASKAMDFIDPSSLNVGSKYTLSKKTPIMPHFTLSDLSDVIYANKGQTITILERKKVNYTLWYKVEFGEKKGWLNSIALLGQQLK